MAAVVKSLIVDMPDMRIPAESGQLFIRHVDTSVLKQRLLLLRIRIINEYKCYFLNVKTETLYWNKSIEQ